MNTALNVKRCGFFLIRGEGCRGNQPNWRTSDVSARSSPRPSAQGPCSNQGESMSNRTGFASKLRVMMITLGVISAVAGLQCQTARAQSTIFNIPSTDAVAKQKVYFEFDFISHLESHDNGGFQTYVPRAVIGLGKGVEVGVNVAATRSAAPAVVYIQPNIKWQFYAN